MVALGRSTDPATGLAGAMGSDAPPPASVASWPESAVSQAIGPDWQSAVKQIRSTADWITKAFVAVAALLIGTGPLLVRFSNLSFGPRALTAGLGAAAALLGVGLVIRWATEVMLPETTDLAELVSAERGPLRALRDHVETPVGRRIYLDRDVTAVGQLIDAMESWQRTVELLAQFVQQVDAFEAQDPRPDESTLPPPLRDPVARASITTTLAGARARLQQLHTRAAELVRQGVYVEVRDTFIRARRMMFIGGTLTAAGVAVYVAALGVHSSPGNRDGITSHVGPGGAMVVQLESSRLSRGVNTAALRLIARPLSAHHRTEPVNFTLSPLLDRSDAHRIVCLVVR